MSFTESDRAGFSSDAAGSQNRREITDANRRTGLVAPLLVIALAVWCSQRSSLIARPAAGPQQAAATGPKTAEQVYKNIQVFKGIPADQLLPSMRYFTVALGVQCNFCHVNPWEKDAKPQKQTARKMIAMVFAVDKETFGGERTVTCYTCHRGSSKPVSVPVIPEAGAQAAERKPATEATPVLPSVDQILDKYVQALGGAEAIRKITSHVEKGTFEGGGGFHAPVEITSKAPNKVLTLLGTPNGNFAQGYDGSVGWEQEPGDQVREMTGDDLAQMKKDAEFYRPLQLKQDYSRLQVDGAEKIGDRDVYRIAAWKGPSREELYFDARTGLLVRERATHTTLMGAIPEETNYEDYRDVSRVKAPFTIRVADPDGVQTVRLDNVQANVPVDDSKFAQPTAKAPEPPKPTGK